MHDALRAGPRPSPLGFTLIELMIVIAIIAIIAAIAIPNLIEARKGSNEAAAIGALRTLTTAQALFREGDKDGDGPDYSTSLHELFKFGLIDEALGTGVKQGYTFTISGAAVFNWAGTADPVTPGKSGDRSFFVDESDVIRFDQRCPPGTVPVKDSRGKITCMPKFTLAGGVPEVHGTVAVETLQIAHEGFLDAAKRLARDPAFVRSVLEGLDADGDGKLTFAEVLDGDLLQLARNLARSLPGTGPSIGDDASLAALLQRFQAGLKRSLELGPSETALPAVQLEGMRGHPAEFLELVPADRRYAALGVVHGLLLQLQESDMTGGPDQHRQQLIAAAERLHDLLRFGELRELERGLEWIGDRSREWVAEPAATEIAQSVETSLRLITPTAR